MSGRKEINRENLWDNKQRQQILNLVAVSPKTITEIEKTLQINRGVLKHHLNLLLKNEFVIKQKEENLAGKPVFISISPKIYDFLKIKIKEQEEYNKRLDSIFKNLEPEIDKITEETAEKLKELQKQNDKNHN